MQTTSRLLVYEQGVPEVSEILAYLQWGTNPFYTVVTDEKSIKIEHIRDLQTELATGSPDVRLVLISPGEKITVPAQQALLKLLEEPPENTLIVIPVRSRQSLLSTIRSRCMIENVSVTQNVKAGEPQLWLSWKHASLREKVELSQEFSGKKDDIQRLFLNELHALEAVAPTAQSLKFRQLLLESLEAVEGNVSPQLCLERVVLS